MLMDEMVMIPGLLPVLLSGFVLAGLAPWLSRWLRGSAGWLLALLPLALFGYFMTLAPAVADGQVLGAELAWAPSLQVNLRFVVDGWGLLLALIVSGMGALVVVYGGGYLRGDGQIGRFYAFVLLFMAAMLVLVLADNLFLLFIAWELTSIASFFLIGYYHEEEKSQQAALQALLVTGAGGLALLAGSTLLTIVGGSASVAELIGQREVVLASPLYGVILALFFAGAFTKSAQFPFHFWLPNAMAGPAPVSTYLHSATMVKAGIYLLARLLPLLGGTAVWMGVLMVVGGVTALWGAWLAWQQTDLKRILAYSTVSALGTMVLLLGWGTELAVETAVLFLLVHALYKGGLFMVAGIVDHETGERDVRRLGGLRRKMPLVALAAGLAAFSMAGVPPLLGFVSKELMYEAGLGLTQYRVVETLVLLVTNGLMVTTALIVGIRPFFGRPLEAQPHHAVPLSMWLGPLLLGALSLLLGLFVAADGVNELLGAADTAVAYGTNGEEISLHLALWHGLTPMLALSGVTLALGVGLYAVHGRLRPLVTGRGRVSLSGAYDWLLTNFLLAAVWLTRKFQNGRLRYYLRYVLLTSLLLIGGTLLLLGDVVWGVLTLTPVQLPELILSAVILAAAGMVVRVDSRLTAVAGLGVVGYGIAVFYILFGAPDLAMTQFSIETLTVILFVLVLYRLPRFAGYSTVGTKRRDALVAGFVGCLMAALALAAQTVETEWVLTDYFAENTYRLAHGHNIVNVILVDFRGFDTLFEITVLSVAAIGVYGLLKARPFSGWQEEERPTNEPAKTEEVGE
jgi:multicomponent Na+:H+ antiporter subunit A